MIGRPIVLQTLSGVRDKFIYEAIRGVRDALNRVLASLGLEYSVTTPATPDTDFVIEHQLGRVVESWLVVHKSAACDLYLSPTAQTDSRLILRATVASVVIRVVLL